MDMEKYQEPIQRLVEKMKVDPMVVTQTLRKCEEFIQDFVEKMRQFFQQICDWAKNNNNLLKKVLVTIPDKKREYRKFVESRQRKQHDIHRNAKKGFDAFQQRVFLSQRRKIIPKY